MRMEEQETALKELASVVNKMSDARPLYWNDVESSSNISKFPVAKQPAIQNRRQVYRNSLGYCFGCGTTSLSTEHIIPSISANAFSAFGHSNGYAEDIDPESPANYLILCGNKGVQGTCHHAYDTLKISLYEDRRDDTVDVVYKWYVCDPSIQGFSAVEHRASIIGRKYTRLLTWRTIRSIMNPGVLHHSPEIMAFVARLQEIDKNSNQDLI